MVFHNTMLFRLLGIEETHDFHEYAAVQIGTLDISIIIYKATELIALGGCVEHEVGPLLLDGAEDLGESGIRGIALADIGIEDFTKTRKPGLLVEFSTGLLHLGRLNGLAHLIALILLEGILVLLRDGGTLLEPLCGKLLMKLTIYTKQFGSKFRFIGGDLIARGGERSLHGGIED
jgi:hypothetical protein